jgi:hypothetical protein
MLNENLDINFVNNKNFPVFFIDNFFDYTFYSNLRKNFPLFNKDKFKKFANDKYALSLEDDYYKSISQNNVVLSDLKILLKSKEFVQKMYSLLYYKILFSNNHNILRTIKYLRPFVKLDSEKKSFFDFMYSKLKISIQFSYMLNNSKIVPHVDSVKEVIALLIYFPQYDENQNEYAIEKKYGTVFWESNSFNYDNQHLLDKDEENLFKKKNKIFYISDYTHNTCCGFIRNDKSWHTVEPFDIGLNYIRRSININFILIN